MTENSHHYFVYGTMEVKNRATGEIVDSGEINTVLTLNQQLSGADGLREIERFITAKIVEVTNPDLDEVEVSFLAKNISKL